MREDMPGLECELRKETCPQRVIDAALRRIAAETPPPKRLRHAIHVALLGALLVCGLLVRWRQTGGNPLRRPERIEQQARGPAQVAREAERALDLFGAVLLDAGARSGAVISDRAMPPLRHGFDTARNKIIRNTEL